MVRNGRLVYALFLLSLYCRICDGQASADCNGANGVASWMGDGDCDPENLSSECNWDGGDCCRCTCEDDDFVCGTDGYMCLDRSPVDDDESTCEEESLPACQAEDSSPFIVETSADARNLATKVNCSGGDFEVKWEGNIVVDNEIVVSSGTVLNITGSGREAIVDGAGKTRLFRVVNGSLTLNGVEVRNGNATFGGAVAATDSNLTMHQTSFINNTAYDKNGGGIFAYRSTVSFSGQTEFFNNSADYGGALYAVRNSSITWEGVSKFTGNIAYHSGGALAILIGSTVSWEAETILERNAALTYRGGALLIEGGSSASWEDRATFVANHARLEGGAIFIDLESNASWRSGAIFSGNSAKFSGGGAMLIAHSSTVHFHEEAIFEFNNAATEGGAVSSEDTFIGVLTSSENQKSFLWFDGTTTFANNTCNTNGGGLALLGGLDVSFGSANVTFSGNVAGDAGGGISIFTLGISPVLSNISFLSNSASTGGGASVTGSSTSDDQVPATFDRCTFIANEATPNGGAIHIASDSAKITDTLFKRNKAQEGGAIEVAIAATIEECTFVENISDMDGGPAISAGGASLEIQKCNFSNNLFNCEDGTFLDKSQPGETFDVVCLGCDSCSTCEIENDGTVTTCEHAFDHSKSSGGIDSTIETLEIDEGYWRATNYSENILACYNKEACKGGLTGNTSFCHAGYTGPYCSVCEDDYAKGPGFTCTKCTENVWGIIVATIFLALSAIITFAAVKYLLSVEIGARQGILARILRRVPLQSVKIIIVAWQILTQFTTVADITYPGLYQRFLHAVDIINFDLTWMISTSCFVVVDFHSQLLTLTLGPIVIMLILGGTYTFVNRKHRTSEEARTIIRHKHVSMILLVMFLVYSSVSSVVFQTFDCEVLDDGKNYLRADYTIQCDSVKHKALLAYAGFMIMLYPLGIPAFFAYLLFQNRNVLMDEANREKALSVRSISHLWKPYRSPRFYYEVIECGRRIVLTGAILIGSDDSAAMIAVTLALAFIFTVVSEGLAPYESQLDAWVSRLGHAVVVSTIYYALLLNVDVSDETHTSQNAFAIVLIGIHVSMVLAVIGETALTTYSISKGQVEDPLPRFQQYRSPRIHFETRTMSGVSHVSSDSLHIKGVELEDQKPAPFRRSKKLRPL